MAFNSSLCSTPGGIKVPACASIVSESKQLAAGRQPVCPKPAPLETNVRSSGSLLRRSFLQGEGVGLATTAKDGIRERVSCRIACLEASGSTRLFENDLGSSKSRAQNWVRRQGSAKKGRVRGVVCQAVGTTAGTDYALGRVVDKSEEGSGWWDSKAAACPAVVRLSDGSWRMYYYGRGGDYWGQGIKAMTAPPMGWIGVAESSDGATWQKLKGPLQNFAVLGPREELPGAFDSVVVGSSDILIRPGGEHWLYYFGGGLKKTSMGKGLGPVLGAMAGVHWGKGAGNLVKGIASAMPGKFTGLHWQIGLAKSKDGLHFERGAQPVLPTGGTEEWDSLYVGWPKVVPPREGTDDTWLMTYHSLNPEGIFWAAAATSADGVTWQKRGQVLGPGGEKAWDELGVGVRHVIRIGDRLAMFYEAVDRNQTHAIGLAWSDNGIRWEKDTECGPEPGGPVFQPRTGEDAWDNKNVGTPHVVAVDDGSYRLYYVGVSNKVQFAIGMAVSDGSNVRRWKRYGS